MKTRKRSTRFSMIITGACLVVFLVSGIVYAATMGTLQINGEVRRKSGSGTSTNDAVRFYDASFVGGRRTGEAISIPAITDFQSMNIVAQLLQPGDTRTIQFRVINAGTTAVRLRDVQTSAETSNTGLAVAWPDQIANSANLTNFVLLPGNISNTFLIQLSWNTTQPGVTTGVFRHFALSVMYEDV